MTSNSIFESAAKKGASDVHIAVGSPVTFRIDGILEPQSKEAVTQAGAQKFIKGIIGEAKFKKLQEDKEIDASYELKNGVRLRINCLYERGNIGMIARVIPTKIPSLEDIDLADVAANLLQQREGLILFTGPTGTGKSTALASMLQSIHQESAEHIITIEDPIEFLFSKGKGIVRQRELGPDFLNFPAALKHVLRQDPNIVMIGEMRDLETIAAALTLAETGHLVFATLHTPNTYQTIDRIVDVFLPHQQNQVRSQLSLSLKAIVAQRLIPGADGKRVAQREVLVNTPAVANIIRDNRLPELRSVLQTGSDTGMRSFEQDAKRLYKADKISKEVFEWAKKGA